MGLSLKGAITKMAARVSASGDVVQVLTVEVHGDFASLRGLMQKPLDFRIAEDTAHVPPEAPWENLNV